MNKVLIAWNVVISGLLIYLFIGNTNTSNNTIEEPIIDSLGSTQSDTNSTDTPRELSKVVFINNDSLFKNFEMYKDLQDELLAEKIKLEGRYKRELGQLEKEYLALREKAPYMTQSQGEAAQADLMQKQQGLVQMEKDLTIKFAKKENELVLKIKVTIEDYLKRTQEEFGYDFVLGKSNMGGIHYAYKGRDITTEVLAGLNEEYAAKKKVKKEK